MKDHAKEKRKQRERMRQEGWLLKQVWVRPEKWERIKRIIDRINKQQETLK